MKYRNYYEMIKAIPAERIAITEDGTPMVISFVKQILLLKNIRNASLIFLRVDMKKNARMTVQIN